MEPLDNKGKTYQVFECRYQIQLADFFDGTHDFKLGNLVNRVDVIHAFLLVLIALVYRVDPNEARLTVGAGLFTLANQRHFRPCFFKGIALTQVRL